MKNPFAKRRIDANLSQEDAASALGIERSTIAKWETGKAKPRADKLPSIARLYGCSISDLLCNDSQENKTQEAV